jgi:hypothetical protein
VGRNVAIPVTFLFCICAAPLTIRPLLGSGRRSFLFDRSADQISPLCPGAVVVADVLDAEKVFQDKPGVGAALADPAIGNNFSVAGDAL